MAEDTRAVIEDDITQPTEGIEYRFTMRSLRYWESIRAGRLFPSENDIDSEAIKEIWDYCYLIQVNDLETRLKVDFTYMGAAIVKSYQDYLSEDDAIDIISPNSSRLSQNFNTVIETKMPLIQSGMFINKRGNTIDFRQSMLPLGATDDRVQEIFGCVRLKVRP